MVFITKESKNKYDGYVTIGKFAKLTGLSVTSVQNRVNKKYIKSKKFSVEVSMIPVEELERVKKELESGVGYMKPGRQRKN